MKTLEQKEHNHKLRSGCDEHRYKVLFEVVTTNRSAKMFSASIPSVHVCVTLQDEGL